MSWQNERLAVSGGNALELDNLRALLVIQQVMKGFFASDAGLLQSVIHGDEDSWRQFVLKYSRVLYWVLDKYCDDYDEKMTVYLHILEKLRENQFSRLRRFEGKAKLSTWLTVVSRHLALDFLRAKYGRDFHLKKIRVVSYDSLPLFLRQLADPLTPEGKMVNEEQRRLRNHLEHLLRQALENLSDQENMAVQLVYFKGLKIKEAGKLLGVRSIYKFVARALEKVRLEMESKPRFCRESVSAVLKGESNE